MLSSEMKSEIRLHAYLRDLEGLRQRYPTWMGDPIWEAVYHRACSRVRARQHPALTDATADVIGVIEIAD